MLDREARHIDSVSVSTPDHMHAPMAMSALQLGKNVYCQKPLTHDLWEARKLAEYAGTRRVVTQMGIQIHATSFYRMAATLARAGAIGRIKEVHCSVLLGRCRGPDTVDPGRRSSIGICGSGFAPGARLSARVFIPFTGAGGWTFGTGTLGDMGCHLLDPGLHGPGAGRAQLRALRGRAAQRMELARGRAGALCLPRHRLYRRPHLAADVV